MTKFFIESIAEEIHNEWMNLRKNQGWTWGPKRNDDLKKNPCMVPYSDLPEAEKEYDRATARTTLTALERLGYKLVPPSIVVANLGDLLKGKEKR
jgi:hypothetical protein